MTLSEAKASATGEDSAAMNDKPKRDRLGFDAKGYPRWEERVAPGEYAPVENVSTMVETLKAGQLSLAETRRMRALNMPYGESTKSQVKSLKTRNGSDYLRALSESIKAKRRAESNGKG